MPDWAAFMGRHGFGTDPAGDAARREALRSARLTGHVTDAQWRELGRLSEESTDALSGMISAALGSSAVRDDLRRRADRIQEEARRLGVDPPAVDDPPVPGHLLTYRRGKAGTEVTCECGRWDGWYNGPRSRRRVLDDHAEHAAAELAAGGPLKVQAVRLDQPELPPGEERP